MSVIDYTSLYCKVHDVLSYLKENNIYHSEIRFSDGNGVSFSTDMGYLFQGLEGLLEALDYKIGDEVCRKD